MLLRRRLLVIELWGLGDLAVATPFLQAASEQFDVTLVAKPDAIDLQARFWPAVEVVPFDAPWTVFTGKYRLYRWPWTELGQTVKQLRTDTFDIGLSARRDPRDHALLWLARVKRRVGFSRVGSRALLTEDIKLPVASPHRYDHWRALGAAIGVNLPARNELDLSSRSRGSGVLLHSGAGHAIRVWPLDRFKALANHLRQTGLAVQVACDTSQLDWWRSRGEREAVAPNSVSELLSLIDHAKVFLGNDSGPGHVAAVCGIPTFTIFGPQDPAVFVPIHRRSELIEGRPCPYRPCWDSCHFAQPHCIVDLTADEVLNRVDQFLQRTIKSQPA